MLNNKYFLELNFLSTLLSTHLEKEEEFFNSQELQEEDFSYHFHKIVIKTINHLKVQGLPLFEEQVADELLRNGMMNQQQWFSILSANPFSKTMFLQYLPTLQKSDKSSIEGI